MVVFELRCGLEILPAGSCRRRLEQGLEAFLSELVQERIAPLDAPAAPEVALLPAQRKSSATPANPGAIHL